MTTTTITLYNSSCFDLLNDREKLPDKSVRLFLLDLPYGITDAEWDVLIDLEEMWRGIKRTMTDDGTIVFFCTTKFGVSIINSNPKWFKYDLVWKKSMKQGFLNVKKKPLVEHEMVYVFNKAKPVYNSQKFLKPDFDGNVKEIIKKKTRTTLYKCKQQEWVHVDDGTRHPGSILDFKSILNTTKDKKRVRWHPTQKPIELLEFLIKSYTNEGDLVCDFCAGSSSAAIAAHNTGRSFIGSELTEEFFDVSIQRFKEEIGVDVEVSE